MRLSRCWLTGSGVAVLFWRDSSIAWPREGALAGICHPIASGDAGPVLFRWLDEKPPDSLPQVVARYRHASKCFPGRRRYERRPQEGTHGATES